MTLVVKIGGAAGTLSGHPVRGTGNEVIQVMATTNILDEVARLVAGGERVVLLHGGSDLTNELSGRLGHPVRTITSPNGMTSRYTDAETLNIYAMAVAGAINTELVAGLQRRGVNALGLCGVDGRLLVARRKSVVRSVTPEGRVVLLRNDYTGQIEQVNASLLEQLLAAGYTPVIAPLALSFEGERLNVDGDRAAAAIASALQADTLVLMTNVPGLLRDVNDATSVIPIIPVAELASCMAYAQGRMRKKLLGAQEALRGGVSQVCIGNESLQGVLNGAGTTIAITPFLVERSLR